MNPAEAALQLLLKQLREQFLQELPERLDEIEALVLAFEGEGLTRDRYQDLYRRVHSLKGSGGTQGVYDITTVCHQMEDVLGQCEGRSKVDSALAQRLLGHVDLLRAVVDSPDPTQSLQDLQARLAALRPLPPQKLYRALLVDDTRLFRGLCQAVLEEAGVQTRVCSDGYQALMPVLREPFDLILTAAEAQILSGPALIAAAKLSSAVNRKTPCILLTATAVIRGTEGTAVGPDHILFKNQQLPQQLRGLLKKLLR